jgi:hypothetical protein
MWFFLFIVFMQAEVNLSGRALQILQSPFN